MKKIHSLQNEVVHYFSKKNLTEQHFIRGTYYNFFTKKLLSENYRDWIPTESFKRNIENNIWYKNSLEESQKLKIDNCKLDLIKYYDEFIELGATTNTDFEYIEYEDLVKMNMNREEIDLFRSINPNI